MLTKHTVMQALIYNELTGSFIWRTHRFKKFVGKPAGRNDSSGHLQIFIEGRRHMAHRIAWLYVHGYEPIVVDHINGVRDDNRISNLRPATDSQNAMNRKLQENNKSGYKGVSFHKQSSMWQASIKMNGKQKYLGLFETPELAKDAYTLAAKNMFGDFHREK